MSNRITSALVLGAFATALAPLTAARHSPRMRPHPNKRRFVPATQPR